MKIYDINYNGNYVIMSDIHGNYEAFKAIIEDVIDTYGKSIDGFIFLGDYAGDYPNGREVVELMIKLNKKYKCYMVTGNRETGMLKKFYECTKNNFKDGHISIEEAENLTGWSINTSMGAVLVDACKMTKEQIEFLIQMPETLILRNKKQTILLKHKTPLTKEEINLLERESKEFEKKEIILLTGHTHDIHDKKYKNIRHFNPGAVALTDTGFPLAYYGVLNHGKILSKSVVYDYYKAISELEKNSILFEKCGQWGIPLRTSILTGINVTALYANERKRLIEVFQNLNYEYAKKIIESNKELSKKLAKELLQKLTIEERPFSIGRYGNTNPYGEHLEVNIYQSDEKGNINIIPKQIISDDIIPKEKLPIRNNLPIPTELIDEIAMEYINGYLEYAIYGSYHINKNRWR